MPSLKQLYFGDANLTSFAGLPQLPTLQDLYVSHNKIASFEGFPTLPSLAHINLDGNPIGSFAMLPISPELTSIWLNTTSVSVTALQALPSRAPNLTKLELLLNDIDSQEFAKFPTFAKLTELSVSFNKLDSAAGLKHNPMLQELVLLGNQLTGAALLELSMASWVSAGDELFIDSNPINCDDSDTQNAISNFISAGVALFSDCG